jgi:hypothetical protein
MWLVSDTDLPSTAVEDRADAFRRLAHENLDASYRLARAIMNDPLAAEDASRPGSSASSSIRAAIS